MNASCLEGAEPSDQAFYLLGNELAREKFSDFLNLLVKKCSGPNSVSDDCNQLSEFVLNIKDSLIDLSPNDCRSNLDGMITVGDAQIDDILNLISKLENTPYIDESLPQYRALSEKQKKMFENYLKLGGNPKHFFSCNFVLDRFNGHKFEMGSGKKVCSLAKGAREWFWV